MTSKAMKVGGETDGPSPSRALPPPSLISDLAKARSSAQARLRFSSERSFPLPSISDGFDPQPLYRYPPVRKSGTVPDRCRQLSFTVTTWGPE